MQIKGTIEFGILLSQPIYNKYVLTVYFGHDYERISTKAFDDVNKHEVFECEVWLQRAYACWDTPRIYEIEADPRFQELFRDFPERDEHYVMQPGWEWTYFDDAGCEYLIYVNIEEDTTES